MTAVTPFTFTDQHTVRTVLIDGEPWFVAADLLAVLTLNRSSIALLDDDEKGVHTVDTPGGPQSVGIVNESGLYSLILRSRKPEAKTFRRWVTHEVLPEIRRTGSYAAMPQSLPEALRAYAEAIEAKERVAAELEAAAPKVEAFDAFMEADGTYTLNAAAKSLLDTTGLGRNRLMAWLRDRKILMADNTPYQRYAHWFKVVTGSHTDSKGVEHAHRTTYVRPEGLEGIRRAWLRGAS